ncbi:hypothetical protein CASFOL_029091 [Castilleja foliolosa]|uniref:Uncharacterized protein n=1 Tax=Castilleja foliolosa TaxID=1961234 RepID=A0ABD3CD14_9LAMI
MGCPAAHAVVFNRTQCACIPGYLLNSTANTCAVFTDRRPAVELSSGVDFESRLAFPATIFSFDSIKKFTQSQAVFLEATLVMLLCWLSFCLILRLFPLGSDCRSHWFKIRWWISRLDITFATRHWLHDQKPLVKRKTELGGAFSIASWILFIDLFAALLYQIISKRSVEVHNIRAVNGPDLASFLNDFEFNITTISSMSCAQLRGLGTILTRDYAYVSWYFVDLPNSPANAVGFQFNLTAKNHDNHKHLSFVSGILRNCSYFDNIPVTFRGVVPNILKFNMYPRLYRNLHDLKLIQPLFQDFLPGSYFSDASQLQASLERPSDGLVNTTLCINFLSSYIVEIDHQNLFGPVSFLADLGGLYCISIGIFFCLLVQASTEPQKIQDKLHTPQSHPQNTQSQQHQTPIITNPALPNSEDPRQRAKGKGKIEALIQSSNRFAALSEDNNVRETAEEIQGEDFSNTKIQEIQEKLKELENFTIIEKTETIPQGEANIPGIQENEEDWDRS